jgi:tetratricopeptide (TPR) repeat protein
MKIKALLLITLIICAINVSAQFKSKEARGAIAITDEADRLLKAGKAIEAEKMLLEANENFPMIRLAQIASQKMKNGDIKEANKLYDIFLKRLTIYGVDHKSYEPYTQGYTRHAIDYFYYSQINDNFQFGDPATGIRAAIDFMQSQLKGSINGFTSDTKKVIFYRVVEMCYYVNDLKSLNTLKEIGEKAEYDPIIFQSKVFGLLVEKKYDEAISLLNTTAKNGAGFMMSKSFAKTIIPFAYYEKGDTENLEKSIKDIGKSRGIETLSYYNGLLALSRKQYATAIPLFTEAMEPNTILWVKYPKPGKFRYYTKRAEAYVGLKDFVNARKDFESALVFNPNYEPALNGLAKLESNQIVEIRKDKTGPEIKILEPANTRGLKIVAAGKDIMIKGMAPDPSGLKSVTINGLSVYIKEVGDFWGTVALADGVNKFEIVATDLAGNITKQIFEIEKTSANVPVTPVAVTETQGKNYAVFIASQNYDDTTIPSLENPIADAIKLKLILKNSYNFADENIYSLFNPQRDDFKKKFLELKEALQPEDNLVIFYAGHGIWVDKEKKGYWLLTDAQRNDVNTWLPNKQVLDMIAELPSRHTLLITDACFSGSVFKSRSIGADAPAALKEMDRKITRVAITSGNDTEVPDVSIFMKYLVKALSENKDKFLTAQKMFITQIIEAVMTESKTEPRYGTLELAGHVGGDFIFTKK